MNWVDRLLENFPWLRSNPARIVLLAFCLGDVYLAYRGKGMITIVAAVASVFWAILIIWTSPKKSDMKRTRKARKIK